MLAAQSALAVTEGQFRGGLAAATWPARFQRLANGGPMHLILGILASMDAASIVDLLAPHALSLTFVPIPDHETHDPAALAAQFKGRAAVSVKDALGPLPAPRLIAGSLYLAGHALALNDERPD